jgi:hypothetical protein
MTDGDEYIYTGRIMSLREVDGKLDKFLGLGYRLNQFYSNHIKPLFYRRKSDNKSSSIDDFINLGMDKELASEKSMKIAFDSVKDLIKKDSMNGVN